MVKRLRLNEKVVREAPPEQGRDYQIFDAEVRGFAVCIYRSGNRAFTLDYRSAGRQRRMTIGRWPEWSTKAARERAKELRREIDAGADPLAERDQVREAPRFDRLIDGLNRLPRPAMALGVLFLIGSAMVDPVWFASRMQGLALAPEPLWWLLGAIVSFYFSARHQVKAQAFQASLAATLARMPEVVRNIEEIRALRADRPGVADVGDEAEVALGVVAAGENKAVVDWKSEPATSQSSGVNRNH